METYMFMIIILSSQHKQKLSISCAKVQKKREQYLPMKEGEIGKEKENFLLGKSRYKFWALAIIIFLAFWSMLSGSASLKWSAGNLMLFSEELDKRLQDDFDVLEIEAREKIVRHMWDIYTHNPRLRLSRFWQEAFEAAYEELESEVPGVKESAISEIAKMSLRLVDMDPVAQKMKTEGGKNDSGKQDSAKQKSQTALVDKSK